MKFASALYLSFLLCAALPAPQSAPASVPNHARVFIDVPIAKGLMQVVVFEDSCIVRLDHGPWSSMIALSALALLTPANGDAFAAVDFCAHKVYSGGGPFGGPWGVVHDHFHLEADVGSLDQVVADVHEQLVEVTADGWVPEPCPPTSN